MYQPAFDFVRDALAAHGPGQISVKLNNDPDPEVLSDIEIGIESGTTLAIREFSDRHEIQVEHWEGAKIASLDLAVWKAPDQGVEGQFLYRESDHQMLRRGEVKERDIPAVAGLMKTALEWVSSQDPSISQHALFQTAASIQKAASISLPEPPAPETERDIGDRRQGIS